MAKIMLVEDDRSLREIYSIRLVAEGYNIISAGDGEEGLALAVKEKPDLIIADVMMPRISGFDMLDILRSQPETSHIKVIMMTALSSDSQRQRGENLGADRYLVKSQVGIEDVVNTVHEVLGDRPSTSAKSNLNTLATSTNQATPEVSTAPAPTPEATISTPETPVATPEAPASIQEAPVSASETPVSIPEAPISTPEAPVATPEPAPVSAPVMPASTPETSTATPEPPVSVPADNPASVNPVSPSESNANFDQASHNPVISSDNLSQASPTTNLINDDMASRMQAELDQAGITNPTPTEITSEPVAPLADTPTPSQPTDPLADSTPLETSQPTTPLAEAPSLEPSQPIAPLADAPAPSQPTDAPSQ